LLHAASSAGAAATVGFLASFILFFPTQVVKPEEEEGHSTHQTYSANAK
jgi:hypothetical protein